MDSITKYRIELNSIFNDRGDGIAIFDMLGTFLIAYILQDWIIDILKIGKETYYLSLIPLGIVIHLITKQNTFLNKQLFDNANINIYKILIIINLLFLLNSILF